MEGEGCKSCERIRERVEMEKPNPLSLYPATDCNSEGPIEDIIFRRLASIMRDRANTLASFWNTRITNRAYVQQLPRLMISEDLVNENNSICAIGQL